MSLTADDFVLYKNAENMMSGGYKLNSIFLKNGVSPMQTVNFRKNTLETNSLESDSKEAKGKNNISSLFEDLAIPAGLFFNNAKLFSENKIPFEPYKEHSVLSDDIFDKLFKMVEYDPTAIKANKYKKTRKSLNGTSFVRKDLKKGFTKKAKKD
jgi:hypothetical protein